jgi:DNA-binding transcriptional MerR regulator
VRICSIVERAATSAEQREATLTIGDVSEATGLSVDTIRYYDRAGLIPQLGRTSAGHRTFLIEHLRWIGLIDRLRTSGMSIRQIRAYMQLALAGDSTIDQRRCLLQEHEHAVIAKITELQESLAIVRAKLALYEGTGNASDVWELVAASQRKRRISDQQ